MSTRQSSFFNMVVTLGIITIVAAVSLGFVYEWTKEPIEQARLNKQMEAIRKVSGTYDNDPVEESFRMYRNRGEKHRFRRHGGKGHGASPKAAKQEEVVTLYPAKRDQELSITAIQAASYNGYSGKIEVMVGIDTAGIIRNIEVLEHRETPGLGSKIRDKAFIGQFLGKSPDLFNMKVKKDGGEVDAISGATISSRAFAEAVQSAYEAYKHQKDEEDTNE